MRSGLSIAVLSLFISACDVPQQQPATKAAAQRLVIPFEARSATDGGLVWLLSTEGLFLQDAHSGQRTPVALPDWQWVAEPYACMPDLALGPKGELVVTSNILPKLWRVDPQTLAVTVHALELDVDNDKDVGFAGLVYSDLHNSFIAVSQLHRSLWMIDRELRKGQKVPLEEINDLSWQQDAAFIRAGCTGAPRF
jgi:hypothetical protein